MQVADAPDFGPLEIDASWTIGIVRSSWHGELTASLANDATAELMRLGVSVSNIRTFDVPGTFELPLACQAALGVCDAVIAIGVVVQGQTHHAELVAKEAAAGLMQVQLALKKPITFEILFVETIGDAETRSKGPKSKGPIAARTVLTSLAKLREIQ